MIIQLSVCIITLSWRKITFTLTIKSSDECRAMQAWPIKLKMARTTTTIVSDGKLEKIPYKNMFSEAQVNRNCWPVDPETRLNHIHRMFLAATAERTNCQTTSIRTSDDGLRTLLQCFRETSLSSCSSPGWRPVVVVLNCWHRGLHCPCPGQQVAHSLCCNSLLGNPACHRHYRPIGMHHHTQHHCTVAVSNPPPGRRRLLNTVPDCCLISVPRCMLDTVVHKLQLLMKPSVTQWNLIGLASRRGQPPDSVAAWIDHLLACQIQPSWLAAD